MSFPLSGLNATYSLNGSNMLALLEMASVSIDMDSVDAQGLAGTDEYNLVVKRGSKHDFTVRQLNSAGVPSTNLDLSVWSIGGTGFLGAIISGSINGTVRTKNVAGIAMLDKIPAFRRRAVEVTTEKMVFSTSLTGAMATGSVSSMSVVVSITFGTETFTQQMVMTAGKITVQGEETTMENVTFKGQGTPSSPSDSSLFGVFFGSAQMGVVFNTATSGGEQFETTSGALGLMTRLNASFTDAALEKFEGTLEIQGPWTYATT